MTEEGGVRKTQNLFDVINGWPVSFGDLIDLEPNLILYRDLTAFKLTFLSEYVIRIQIVTTKLILVAQKKIKKIKIDQL